MSVAPEPLADTSDGSPPRDAPTAVTIAPASDTGSATTAAAAAAEQAARELVALLKERKEREAALAAALRERDAAVRARDEVARLCEVTMEERDSLLEARVIADARLGTYARGMEETEEELQRARDRVAALADAVTAAHMAAEAARAKERALALAAEVVAPLGLQFLHVPEVTLRCLRKSNPLRRFSLILARAIYFDWFILANIAVNFLILAATSPLQPSRTAVAEVVLEPWFQALFTFEAIIKIIASS
jgi:hypothetical protein